MDTGYQSCFEVARALADAGDRFGSMAQLVSGWKGVESSVQQVSIVTDASVPTVSFSLQVQTQSGAFWLWALEVRLDSAGWLIRDARDGLDQRGLEQATEMPAKSGEGLEGLVEGINKAVTDILRNVESGWWLRVQPKGPRR